MSCRNSNKYQEIIGLIPAAGQAARLSPLPCSKEVLPIGFWKQKGGSLRPKAVCHYLVEKMKCAGIQKTYFVLRRGKWDIPSYLNNGSIIDMNIAYLIMEMSSGVPYTLDYAYPFLNDAIVAIGFPDIIFEPRDAFVRLLDKQEMTGADVVLGVFPTDEPHKWDMVERAENGQILKIDIKPLTSELRYSWVIAVWTPVFTQFMHEYLLSRSEANQDNMLPDSAVNKRELVVGDILQAAIENDLTIESVLFPDNRCIDIGTPEDLERAMAQVNGMVQHDNQ